MKSIAEQAARRSENVTGLLGLSALSIRRLGYDVPDDLPDDAEFATESGVTEDLGGFAAPTGYVWRWREE